MVMEGSPNSGGISADDDMELDGYVVRASDRRIVTMPEINIRYEFFTPECAGGHKARMTGSCLRLKPGQWSTEKNIVHEDLDESVYLLQGDMEAFLSSRTFRLGPGDNLYIPSGTPHNLRNAGDIELIVLVHLSSGIV